MEHRSVDQRRTVEDKIVRRRQVKSAIQDVEGVDELDAIFQHRRNVMVHRVLLLESY